MSEPICSATTWRHGVPYICDLRPGHEPPHVDTFEGCEW